jgi:hypothetical protein
MMLTESLPRAARKAGFLQQPALMIAVKVLFHSMFLRRGRAQGVWMRKVGDGTETTVEQALMRGLFTA